MDHPTLPREHTEALVNTLPGHTLAFVEWHMLYSLYYVAHIERGRTDLRFVCLVTQDGKRSIAVSALRLIDDTLEQGHPVIACQKNWNTLLAEFQG